MTDDLRTRAREVAESLYGPPREDEWMRTTVERGAWAAGWENGYLAHAAQQPTREQLHTEFLYRMRTVAAHYRVAGKRGEQVEAGWIEAEADKAVLALLNGDKS